MRRIMNIRLFVLARLCAVSAAGIAALFPPPAQAIVGGELDGDGHPNVGTFVVTRANDPNLSVPSTRGSGTLIHPRVVVTAAHVVIRVWELRVAEGRWNRADLRCSFAADALEPASWRGISAMVVHPQYRELVNPATGVPPMDFGGGAVPYPDVGLVILEEPAQGLAPATLAAEGFLDALVAAGVLRSGHPAAGATFTVVGYGAFGSTANDIQPGDGQRRVASSGSMFLQPRWLFLNQNAALGNGGTAEGDSGGPVFWVDPGSGQATLVSLTSRGDAVGVATGTAYRADTAEALDFVRDVIERVDAGEFDE